jgi:hypothetical protein
MNIHFSRVAIAEPHHVDGTPALGKIFDEVPAPTLLFSKAQKLT